MEDDDDDDDDDDDEHKLFRKLWSPTWLKRIYFGSG
jgi:hypothetical protein